VDLYSRLIELTEAQKDWPEVSKYAERLLAINPLLSRPHRALAEAGMATGNSEQAVTAWRKLLLLDPPDPVDAHFQLARLLRARGGADAPEAKRQLLQALEDAPRFQAALQLLVDLNSQIPETPTAPPASKPGSRP